MDSLFLLAKIGGSLLAVGAVTAVPLVTLTGTQTSPSQKIFKANEGLEENCRSIKLSSSATGQNLKLWACSFSNDPLTPVFYFFNNGGDHRSTHLTGPYTAYKVSKIELQKNTKRGGVSQKESNYDLNIWISDGTKSWSWLVLQDGTNRKPPKKDTVNTVFLVKHSITELKPEDCKLELQNSKFEAMKCKGKKYSFEKDKKGFF